MKLTFAKILFLFFGFFFLSFTPLALATSDSGDEATFIGWMGAHQEFALIYFEDIQDSQNGTLYAIKVGQSSTVLLNPVKVRSEEFAENKKVTAPELLQLQKTLTDGDKPIAGQAYRALYQYYLSRIPQPEKKKWGTQFIAANQSKSLRLIEMPASIEPYEGKKYDDWVSAVRFQLPSKQLLIATPKVLKTFDAIRAKEQFSKTIDEKETEDFYCQDRDQNDQTYFICSNCTDQTVEFGGIQEKVASCENKPGKVIRGYTQITWAKQPQIGAECNCHDKGYFMALELKVLNQTSTGNIFAAYPAILNKTQYSKPFNHTSPPSFFYQSGKLSTAFNAYQNQNGQLVVVGALTQFPTGNGTYFPVVATHPGSNTAQ